ncbi:MAG: hypothetical protein KDK30_10155 [Leptospiraceae bacterium]|nr:hypothetical protein [Leptospiraceae bacterium]
MRMRQYLFLLDEDTPAWRPLSRFRSPFSFRNGIYSPIERLRSRHPEATPVYFHPDEQHENLISELEGFQAYRQNLINHPDWLQPTQIVTLLGEGESGRAKVKELSESAFVALQFSNDPDLFSLLNSIGSQLLADLTLWKAENRNCDKERLRHVHLIGNPDDVYIHSTAEILPGVVLDARNGPIIIDARASVSPFTYIEGPSYAGPDARLDNLRLTGGSILGHAVRAGGEIENSIFQDYSNKHHEGFVGHSLIGAWVNLGALTTTSDLKNNYGSVRIRVPAEFLFSGDPAGDSAGYAEGSIDSKDMLTIDTGTIKFGSIIGDCVKTAIGTMLNTGSVLDAGSNIFGGRPDAYQRGMSWGLHGNRYDPERFYRDCRKIFTRRGKTAHEALLKLATRLAGWPL